MDNFSTHHAKKVKEWLKRHPTLELVFLPTNSLHLNRIARVFGVVQRECLNNCPFESLGEVEGTLATYLDYFNTQRRELV